jgi:hypothetical protein
MPETEWVGHRNRAGERTAAARTGRSRHAIGGKRSDAGFCNTEGVTILEPWMIRRRALADEDGSILPLTIFFGMLSLVLILLVVAATSLYLERKRLFTLADGAALAGAEAFTLDSVMLDGSTPTASLDSADVHAAASEFLAENPVSAFDHLELVEADSVDGASATVRVAAIWHPPVVSLLVPDGIRLEARSVARSVLW